MPIDFQRAGLPAGIVGADARFSPAVAVAFTEGPAADAFGNVFFTDIVNNRILKFDSRAGTYSVWRADSGRANGLLFDPQGRLLACEGSEFGPHGRRRVTRTDLASGEVEVLTDRYEGARYNSPNDIAACTNGWIFFTDPCYGDRSTMELTHDSVYRIDPNRRVTRVLTQPEIQRPNGIALSPDEQTLYLVDSCPVVGGNRKIWAFDLDADGLPRNQRLVFDFAPGRGGDGMAVDQEGVLYVAAGIARPRGPHETTDVPPGIYLIAPSGKLLGRIPVVEDVLTNVTFGGDDLRTLYVTAGKTLFSVRVAVPGFVVHRKTDVPRNR
jgi:gluconolactonase